MAAGNEPKQIFSEKEINEYFNVSEMYLTSKNFAKKTILYFCVEIKPPETDSNGSLAEYLEDELKKILLTVDKAPPTSPMSGKLRNERGEKHAEIILLTALQSGLTFYKMKQFELKKRAIDDTNKTLNLEIIINYSPCFPCAEEIRKFKEQYKDICNINISITFGSFYLVYPKDDKNKNIEGLGNLLRNGIKLNLWSDCERFKNDLDKIGCETDRKERRKKDQEYMELVRKYLHK